MLTIAGGIVLGFGALWLIGAAWAQRGEIGEALIEMPKIILGVGLIGVLVFFVILAWRAIPDWVQGCVAFVGFIGLTWYATGGAIRDIRAWRRKRENGHG